MDRINVEGDLLFDHVESVRPMQVFQAQVDGEVRIRVPAAKTIQVEGLTAGDLIVSLGKDPVTQLDLMHVSAGRLSLAGAEGAIAEGLVSST